MKPLLRVARGSALVFLALVFVGACLLSGCLASSSSEGRVRPTLLNPQWQEKTFAKRLDFFYDAFADGASPASRRVGDYVQAAMHDAWLQPALEDRYRLGPAPYPPLGYVGYVAGKRPHVVDGQRVALNKQAVLVCADLAGARTTPEATALLEVARVYGIAAQYSLVPERSVIFALWPDAGGRRDPLAGLRAYLRRPTWRLSEVQAVFYVGLAPALGSEAQALLKAHDLPLYRIPLPAAEEAGTTALKKAAVREDGRVAPSRVRHLAQRVHERLRAATLTGGKMMPSLGDTLRVPRRSTP